MSSHAKSHVEPLISLGFTELEAEIYSLLVQSPPATGYGLAKTLEKPVANVYKALQSLESKGAAIVDDGKTRKCRATPLKELLDRLEKRFKADRRRVEDVLSRFTGPEEDMRIYQLRTPAQVMERCRGMLAAATQVALLDVFPEPFVELSEDLRAAAARGVDVVSKVYEQADIPGVELFLDPDAERTRSRWPAQWVNIVVDGSELLIGMLESGGRGVVQAVWSGSPYLAWILHSYLTSDLASAAVGLALKNKHSLAKVREIFTEARRHRTPEAPGYFELLKRLGGHSPRRPAEGPREKS